MASGPNALADSPVAVAPLPLAIAPGQAGDLVRINPFCEPLAAAQGAPGAAPVPGNQPADDSATARWPAEPVRPAAVDTGIVQLTPLVALDGVSQVVQSSGRQVEVTGGDAEQGGVQFQIHAPRRPGAGVHHNPLVRSAPVPVSDVQGVKPLIVAAHHAGEPSGDNEPSGAISYSFSDEPSGPVEATIDLSEPVVNAVVRQAPVRERPVRERVEADSSTHATAQKREPRTAAREPQQPSPTLARPSAAARTILVPIEAHGDTQVASSGQARLVNGARPKVEVGRPPLVVQRERSLSFALDAKPIPDHVVPTPLPDAASPTPLTDEADLKPLEQDRVAQVAGPQESQSAAAAVELPVRGNLRFKPTEVRALKTDQPIQRAETESVAVCAAVKTGANQVQLIATGAGTTRLTVWTIDQAGNEQAELYEIQVTDPQVAHADDGQSMADTLTQSISSAFPHSRVRVGYRSGRLVLRGVCDHEQSARRIVRMVRSACPMPVDDELVVR